MSSAAAQNGDAGRNLNRASYDAVAAQWAAARSGFYGREALYLDTVLEGLVPGSLVLDAGCGSGHPLAEAVVARGHRVLGVDQSARLLELARARLPGQSWVLSSLEEHPFVEPVDAALCWDTLFHISRERHGDILARLCRSLAPGGRLMLSVGGSAHPPFTDVMFGREFFYDSHPPEGALRLLGELGLQVLVAEHLNPPTEGRDKGRYALVAQKPRRS